MYLIVDLEATCFEIPKTPDLNEVIDIGIVVCDHNFNIIGSWTKLVKPKINVKLSGFCLRLTKIQQQQIDEAQPLVSVINEFKQHYQNKYQNNLDNIIWYTWGDWDVKCLNNDCNRNEIPFPFGQHKNLRNIYAQERNDGITNKCSIKEVLHRENLQNIYRLHRGIGDAYAAAHIARIIYQNK